MERRFVKAALAAVAAGLIAFAAAASAPAGSAGTSLTTHAWSSHLSAPQVRSLSAGPDQRVIVLLRNQYAGLRAEAQREQAFSAERTPVVAQLQQLHAPRIVTYHTLNAVATTVSAAEKANLLRDPAVLAVDPDSVVKGPSSNADLLPTAQRSSGTSAPGARRSRGAAKAVSGSALCGTASAPLLEPQALSLINADNRTNADAPLTSGPPSAHSLGYTGSGVNIAVFPDGVDPSLPDFQRGGQSAVTDYQDFTGEGASAPTTGGEAFGDVSSLVAQGNTTYNLDQELNPDFATSGGTCDVKVLGVAPGASVDVMKVFGNTNLSFTSVILQGIDYALQHDHPNILSISIGFFAVPTTASEQPLTAILENAIKAGTTVVASTGDASPSNTEESPALDPGVIGAAASTSYRLLAQTNLFLYDMGDAILHHTGNPSYHLGQITPGWLDNEVSTLSSSGATEDGRAPDILAPGDLNWADCSTDTATYSDCANSLGGSTVGLEDFGGTSESAPLTAGVAALVIQAYRMAHGGSSPSPAVVSKILFSSATNIGVAPEEQGAGLLNALRAVELAKTYGKHGSGGGLVFSPSSVSDLGAAGVSHSHKITVTNTGSAAALVSPELRTLGKARTLAHGSRSLYELTTGIQGTCAGVDSAEYFTGETIPELNCVQFTVPKGVDELDSRIGWNPLEPCSGCTAGEPTVREILIDPAGRYGQYSDPQGDGAGFADEQIHQPKAGTWTLLIFGRDTSNYEGPVSFLETAQTFRTIHGAVSPAAALVAPGKSASFTVKVKAPAKAGFFTGALVLKSNKEPAVGTLPVVSEAKVSVSTTSPGQFTGTLIGGNGRPTIYAQQLSYRFTVPKGVHDLDVNMTTANDGYLLMANLVDPHGVAVDNQLSYQQVTAAGDDSNTHSVQLVWANPMPGTWKVDVENGLFYLPGMDVYSGLTQSTLNGTVSFNTSKVTATGLPSGTLQPGQTVTAAVKVTNTGTEPETYQLDPRTSAQTPYAAQSATPTSGALPIMVGSSTPQYIVPPFSSQLQLTASTTGSAPIEFDVSPYWGAPDVASAPSTGGSTSVTVANPFASEWGMAIDEVGPFGSTAPAEDYSTGGTVTTLGFDDNALPSTGDLWEDVLGDVGETLNPLFLLPGQSGTMTVTFTVPSGLAGTKVSGEIPVETFDFNSFTTGIGDWSSDVLKVLPYSYTLG
ncbi:MAG TPA: S8 family serine peptidase [Gaiellaceae bacterium]|nr:S8 family serine peptidase [Gaiellaceae bacterium]